VEFIECCPADTTSLELAGSNEKARENTKLDDEAYVDFVRKIGQIESE
jgi:hypothetical protein